MNFTEEIKYLDKEIERNKIMLQKERKENYDSAKSKPRYRKAVRSR